MNKQNLYYWPDTNTKQLHIHPFYSSHITVRRAVANFRFIGPYFFDEEGETVTVSSAQYTLMLQEFFAPELHHRGIDLNAVWFQQDGATALTARTPWR